MIKFFPGGEEEASNYTYNCDRYFTPICPFCGRLSDIKTSPNRINRIHGVSCVCKDGVSVPNKVIRILMEQCLELGLISSYEKEHKEYDEKGNLRRFDMKFFDLENNPYFVEMDGGRHGYIIKEHSNKEMVFLPAKLFYPDLMKDRIAERLNIPLIRIDCFYSDVEYIRKNIYESKLNNVINLDAIDWLKIEDICFKSIMTDVCNYKKENPESFASQIAEIFNISSTTVRTYLKRGTKLGLCEYSAEEESERSNNIEKDWYQSVGVYVENLDTLESWTFKTKTDFCDNSKDILDGD